MTIEVVMDIDVGPPMKATKEGRVLRPQTDDMRVLRPQTDDVRGLR